MEKERRTKALLLSTLVVVVATLSIAFASLSRTLNINGTAKMSTASWSVYFDNLSNAKITRGAEEIGKPSISDDKGTVQDINVKLSNPKDEISYTVDIVNDGTIDAEITMIKDVELTDIQKKVLEFKVEYVATGEVVTNGDLLKANSSKKIKIIIRFKDDITEYDLPTENQVINLSYQITYTQYGENNIVDNGNSTTKSVLAFDFYDLNIDQTDQKPFFDGNILKGSVESIDFLESNIVPDKYLSTSWDASFYKDGSVMAWYTDSDGNGFYEVFIGGNDGVYAPQNSSFMFCDFYNLKRINFNNNFNTSDVTDMMNMFSDCKSLTSLNLNSFNTSNVNNISEMFEGCSSLSNIEFDLWNVQNIKNINGLFSRCSSLVNINLNHFNGMTSFVGVFEECISLKNVELNFLDASNIENVYNMFKDCIALETLDLSNWNMSKVTIASGMFENCTSLTNLDLRNAEFSNIENYEKMFEGVINANIIVKNDTQINWLKYRFGNFSNLLLPSEL